MSKEVIEPVMMDYKFITKDKKMVTISIEDTAENPKFKMTGPKDIMNKVVGGLGEENESEAWVTDKELNTEAKRSFAILELMKLIQ